MNIQSPSNEYLIGCLQRRVEELERDVKALQSQGWFMSVFSLATCVIFWYVVYNAPEIKRKANEDIQAMIDKSIEEHEAKKETK